MPNPDELERFYKSEFDEMTPEQREEVDQLKAKMGEIRRQLETPVARKETKMEGLTEGRIVHFVMPNGEHRPAIIVRVWRDLSGVPEGYSNLVVFVDGGNDLHYASWPDKPDQVTLWETSIHYSEKPEPRTWHWIEKA